MRFVLCLLLVIASEADEGVALRTGTLVRVARPLLVLVAVAPVFALLLGGFERRWMDDDGFINLRIVRNLLHGLGPVFNLDERVEAGTSPLWLGVVAILGALGIRLEHAAVFAGIALSGAGLILAQNGALRLNGGRSRSLGERPAGRW